MTRGVNYDSTNKTVPHQSVTLYVEFRLWLENGFKFLPDRL
jgi:hypothetical protein